MKRTRDTRIPAWFGPSVLALGCAWTSVAHARSADPRVRPGNPAEETRVLATVPVRFDRNLVLLPVSVGESETFDVVLDTGMPISGLILYRSPRVDGLPLEFQDAHAISGAGGEGGGVPTRVAPGARIRIGGLEIEDVPVIALEAPAAFAGAVAATKHEGIIGSELFEKYAVRIDRDARTLTLLEAATFRPADGASVVPLVFHGPSPFVEGRVAVGKDDAVPVELAVDLGASHALWLNAGAKPELAAPERSLATRLGRGLSGSIEGKIGRVRRFELGDLAFEGVVTLFPEGAQQRPGGQGFRDGFLGGEILSRFRATFDYPGKRLVLEPGLRRSAPFEHDMSGLVLEPGVDGRPTVGGVLPGTPAEDAGVRAGDVLLTVDGERAKDLGPDGLQRAFRRDGAEIVLTILRDGAPVERKLRLRRLV